MLDKHMHGLHIRHMTLDDYLSDRNLTDTAFGAQIGRSQSAISRLRRGLTKPDWETLERIKDATSGAVTPNDFLSEPPPHPNSNGAAA